MATDSRWSYKALAEDTENPETLVPDQVLEMPLTKGWKLIEMDRRFFDAFTTVGYKNEQFLLDVLEALACPQAADVRLVVTRSDIVLESSFKPIDRPRRK